jgi:hypothetical protein
VVFAPSLDALLSAGADVNAQAHDGRTPLHVFLDEPRELLDPGPPRLLAASGADLTLRDATGRTPLDAAMHEGYPADFSTAKCDHGSHLRTGATTSVNLRYIMIPRLVRALLGAPLAMGATLAAIPISMFTSLWRWLNHGRPPWWDVARKMEPTEEWKRMEAPYVRIDPILTAFAARHAMELRKNHWGANRYLSWSDNLGRVMWLYSTDEYGESGTYHVSIIAYQDRGSERYTKAGIVAKDVSLDELDRTLERARDILASWSPSDLRRGRFKEDVEEL